MYSSYNSWEEALLSWIIFTPIPILFIIEKYRLLLIYLVLALFLEIRLFGNY